jgi:hypothetical protein
MWRLIVPRLSQYFVKSSFICFLLGFTLGGLMLASKAGSVTPIAWLWLPAHHVLLINGWMVQLAMGVAYWIFPRILLSNRGRPQVAWAAFAVLQIGLALTIVSLVQVWWPPASQLLAPGVVLHTVAVLLFVVHAWPRVRAAIIRTEQDGTHAPESL